MHFFNEPISPNKIVHAWNAMIEDFQVEKLDLLEQLSNKYPLFLLSNTNELHLPVVRQRLAKHTTKNLMKLNKENHRKRFLNLYAVKTS